MQESAAKLRKEDREVGRGRKWRQNYRLLNQEVLLLEEEEKKLELVYPQVGQSHVCCHPLESAVSFPQCAPVESHSMLFKVLPN